jgi:hypothetical protein
MPPADRLIWSAESCEGVNFAAIPVNVAARSSGSTPSALSLPRSRDLTAGRPASVHRHVDPSDCPPVGERISGRAGVSTDPQVRPAIPLVGPESQPERPARWPAAGCPAARLLACLGKAHLAKRAGSRGAEGVARSIRLKLLFLACDTLLAGNAFIQQEQLKALFIPADACEPNSRHFSFFLMGSRRSSVSNPQQLCRRFDHLRVNR